MKITYQLVGRCLWHSDCIEGRGNGIMKSIKREKDRDLMECQHCGKKTRPDFKNVHHPLYPNLDHILPLVKGGEHTKRNTQCLCHRCNLVKGMNEIGEQIRMFG